MPVFLLNDSIEFPPVEYADENGIIAIGGNLSSERLINAYKNGIFPWYSEDEPILWWSPDPRFVLFPKEVKISKSMKQILNRKIFTITYDQEFMRVVQGCQRRRKKQDETWITIEMMKAYIKLHNLGLAHSVEVWEGDKLAGGLYGISLGRCFFGESMFTRVSNASKAAFITLTKKLYELNFKLIDCQVYTAHMKSLGARQIPRNSFLKIINKELKHDTLTGNWGMMKEFK